MYLFARVKLVGNYCPLRIFCKVFFKKILKIFLGTVLLPMHLFVVTDRCGKAGVAACRIGCRSVRGMNERGARG